MGSGVHVQVGTGLNAPPPRLLARKLAQTLSDGAI